MFFYCLEMNKGYIAQLVGNRVIIWDIQKGTELYSNGFYGKPIGVRKPQLGDMFRDPLELSYFETLYLLENEKLSLLVRITKNSPKISFLRDVRTYTLILRVKWKCINI